MDGRRQDFYLDQSFYFFFFFRLFGQVKFTLVAMNLTMACDLFIIHLIFTSFSLTNVSTGQRQPHRGYYNYHPRLDPRRMMSLHQLCSVCLFESSTRERGGGRFQYFDTYIEEEKGKTKQKAYTQHSNGPEREREEGRFFAISNTQTDQFSVSSTSSGRLGRGGESEAELCRERGLIAKQTRTWLELLLLLPLQLKYTHIRAVY